MTRRSLVRFLPLPENESARLAVQDVAMAVRGKRIPPCGLLYCHGHAGAGKSHLIDALVAGLSGRDSDAIIARHDANDLNLPESPPPGKLFAPSFGVPGAENDWRASSRQADLLIVEDLQHLGPRAVDAVCDLLDERSSLGLPSILTARLAPQHLAYRGSRFSARFTSRLTSGLVVHLQPLQAHSRCLLLQEMAQQRQLPVSRQVLRWLAETVNGGGRRLLGALERIDALWRSGACGRDSEALFAHLQADSGIAKPNLASIAEHVGRYFQVNTELLQSPSRLRNIMLPRQVSMYLARQLTALSLEQIGAYFGRRDHTTVLHACRKVEQALECDPRVSGAVRQIHAELT